MQKLLFSKIGMIGGLVLLLLIPLGLIKDLINERVGFREQARGSIRQSWTGEQRVLGPVLVVPYEKQVIDKVWDKKARRYRESKTLVREELYLLPEILNINGDVATEERKRGLYSIPVYTSALAISGRFSNELLLEKEREIASLNEMEQKQPAGAKAKSKRQRKKPEGKKFRLQWKKPYLSVMVSDLRGVVEQPGLEWEGVSATFEAGSRMKHAGRGMHAVVPEVELKERKGLNFSFQLTLRGMDALSFAPLGSNTHVQLRANWPHPSATGRYLPKNLQVDNQGFRAEWTVSSFSSLIPQALAECVRGSCQGLQNNIFGVSFIKTADIYQQSQRSVKYGILFLVLTFTLFFVYEVMKSMSVHPMQYLLVGLALSVFFLLLISLSEHFSFTTAYVAASSACTLLLGVYVSAILKGVKGGVLFGGLLALLYGVLFFIIRSEDNALLMGSLLLFAVLSSVMVVTRHIDWYGLSGRLQVLPDSKESRPGEVEVKR